MASPSASSTPESPLQSPPPPGTIAGWRIIVRIAGALFTLAIFSYWAAAGSNTGWTKDQIPIKKTDEITGIEYVEYRKHFLPGIEFLLAGTGIGVAVIAFTFFSRKKTKHIS